MAGAKQSFSDEPEVFRPTDADAAGRAQRRGELRRLARGLYTWNLDEPVEQLLRRRWMDVAALYFPGAVLVGRSAIEARPAADGSLFLDSGPEPAHPSVVRLPGLVLKPSAGPGPTEGDMPFGDLHRSGEARTALDNLRPSRARGGVSRALTAAELEEWLERIARNRGESELLRIRDEAREIAPTLSAEDEQARLDELIATLLGTGDSRLLTESATRSPRRASRPTSPTSSRAPSSRSRRPRRSSSAESSRRIARRRRPANGRSEPTVPEEPASSPPAWFLAPCVRPGASTRRCPPAFRGRSSPCSRSARSIPSPTATAASLAPCSTPS